MPKQPVTSRDYYRAGLQRLAAATFLLKNGYNLDAMYLAGYVIECGLKAVILASTARADRPAMVKRISSGKRMHEPEVLTVILRERGVSIPVDLARCYRRSDWSVNLRYATGRADAGETRWLVNTGRATLEWAEAQLP